MPQEAENLPFIPTPLSSGVTDREDTITIGGQTFHKQGNVSSAVSDRNKPSAGTLKYPAKVAKPIFQKQETSPTKVETNVPKDLTLKQFADSLRRKYPREADAYKNMDDWHFAARFIDSKPERKVYQQRIKDWPGSAGDPNLLQMNAPKDPRDLGEYITQSAKNMTMDLLYGTTSSIAGRLFKAVGGHPLGDTNQGHILASVPLGALQILEGGGQLMSGEKQGDPRMTWQGTKNVVGGTLKASEIPLAFMAPEGESFAANKTGQAARATGSKVKRGIATIKQYANPKSATIPVTTAPRELKMGEMVQKIVSKNIGEAEHTLFEAQKEVERIDDLIILSRSKLHPTQYNKLEPLYKARNEAQQAFGDATELHAELSKFERELATHKSPEKLIVDIINGRKDKQTLVQNVLKHLEEHPRAVRNLQDTVMRGIVEKNTRKVFGRNKEMIDWVKVQQDLLLKGDMSKDLFGSRYYPILKEINQLAQQQQIGKVGKITAGTLAITGLGSGWFLRHIIRNIVLP